MFHIAAPRAETKEEKKRNESSESGFCSHGNKSKARLQANLGRRGSLLETHLQLLNKICYTYIHRIGAVSPRAVCDSFHNSAFCYCAPAAAAAAVARPDGP